MKKILGTIAVSALATASSFALTGIPFMTFTGGATIALEDGTTVSTLGSGESSGYIAAYWWSADDTDGSYQVLGISAFTDVTFGSSEWDGGLFFTSPGIVPVDYGDTSYIGVTVFRFDDLVGTDASEWSAWISSLAVGSFGDTNALAIETLWNDAQNGSGQIGSWFGGRITHDMGGAANEDVLCGPGGLNWGGNVQYLSRAIPEPSTWLLFGTAATFVVLFRRKR